MPSIGGSRRTAPSNVREQALCTCLALEDHRPRGFGSGYRVVGYFHFTPGKGSPQGILIIVARRPWNRRSENADGNRGSATKLISFSETWTFFEGDWHEGNVPIMGPRTHGAWLASTVFDGARAFEGVAPDLDRHCERVNQSAINFKLKPVIDSETWLALAREGIARFDANAELYIRPMYWAQTGSGGGVLFDPETTNWCMWIYVAPMPPTTGSAITLSPFRRPTMENAPVDCKAGCLYPNNSRARIEAQARGFGWCLIARHARQCRRIR